MTELYITLIDEVFKLDLDENIPITLQKTFKDYKDISNTQVPKTLPIKLPNTKTNREIFGDFLLINGANPNTSYKTAIEGELLVNGKQLITGQVQVLGYDKTGEVINIVLYNKEYPVFKILKDEFMSALDFSDLNHPVNFTNITNSWSKTLNGGKTIYPLADNGQGFGYQNPDNLGFVIDITAGDSIDSKTQSPAFELSELITRLFDDIIERTNLTGWSFNIDLTDIFYWHNLKPTEAQVSPVDITASGIVSYRNFIIQPQSVKNIDILINDDAAGILNNGVINAIHSGNYKINFESILFSTMGLPSGIVLQAFINNVFYSDILDYTNNNNFEATIPLNTGDTLSFKLKNTTTQPYNITLYTGEINITALGTAGLAIAGGTIYANNYFKKIKKADFLRDLIKMFNLVIYINNDNQLILETYDDWLNGGNTVDLSGNILDGGQQILSPYSVLYKTLRFKFKESEDFANKEYLRDREVLYGSGDINSNISFLTNELDNTVTFSPYLRTQLQTSLRGAASVSGLYGIKNTNSPQDLDPSAYGDKYLIYWNGAKSSLGSYKIDGSTTSVRPLFSNYNISFNYDIKTTDNDLNFFFTSPPTASGYSFASDFDPANSNSLVNRFYKNYITQLYADDAKILSVSAVLLPDEFDEIENNSKIIIDGVIYIILDLKYALTTYTAKLTLLKVA